VLPVLVVSFSFQQTSVSSTSLVCFICHQIQSFRK